MYYHADTYLKAADIYPTANADPDPQCRPNPNLFDDGSADAVSPRNETAVRQTE